MPWPRLASSSTSAKRRGVGVAAGAFGIGGPGDQSMVAIELDPDDGVTVYGAVADPGEGNDSMLLQLTADALDLPLHKVRLQTRSTENTTANGPAAASRHTYMSGGSLLDGIGQLKAARAESGATTYAELQAAGRPTRFMGTKKMVVGALDPQTGQGPSFESQVHALQLAEVEVDTASGEVRVIRMTCAVDAGRVIHPLNFAGQIEGGMDMGVGLALRESYVPGQTKDWVTFKYPSMRTAFDMDVVVRESPRPHGSNGSVGVGEMTLVATAPAVLNAIDDAVGVRIYDLPATPDRVEGGPRDGGAVTLSAQRDQNGGGSGHEFGLSRRPRTIAGRIVTFDNEGFLWSADDWSEEVAAALAAEAGVAALDDTQWRVLRFLRAYFRDNGRAAAQPGAGGGHRDAPSAAREPVPGGHQAGRPPARRPAQPQDLHCEALGMTACKRAVAHRGRARSDAPAA